MEKDNKKIGFPPIEAFVEILQILCNAHRNRFGILQKPRVNDCEKLACKTGCPIKKLDKIWE